MSARASSPAAVGVPRFQIGIDENGLGPRLGPMVVTAARLHVAHRVAHFPPELAKGIRRWAGL